MAVMLKAPQNIARFSSLIRIILLLMVGVIPQGCLVLPIEKTDLSDIKPGASRELVESTLGEAVSEDRAADVRIAQYRYNGGSPAHLSLFLFAPLTTIGDYYEQREILWVVYDGDKKTEPTEPISSFEHDSSAQTDERGDDRVIFSLAGAWRKHEIDEFVQIYSKAMEGDASAQSELDEILKGGKTVRSARMHRKYLDAEAGNVDAQFQLGAYSGLEREEAWVWLCRAANQGHASASYRVAQYFHYGHSPISQDYKKAYIWYLLTMRFGSPQIKIWSREEQDYIPALKALEKDMMPDEVVRARQSAADWKPNPSECEIERVEPSSS